MAQQDKISILGPRDDGTYIVEFRTVAGERLAISVPETKATVLKHFQAATAEPHIPTPDRGVMKPEIRNVLQIGWTVVRGILELAILATYVDARSCGQHHRCGSRHHLRDDPQHGALPILHDHANGVGGRSSVSRAAP